MAEQLICNQQVAGSSPIFGSIFTNKKISHAEIAQLAEQLICNQQVAGSSPIFGSKVVGFPSWPKGADCKSASDAFEGSNPSPTTSFFEMVYMPWGIAKR